MSRSHPSCRAIEPDLVALAGGEATPAAAQAVEEHTAGCPPCRDALRQYRAVEGLVADLRHLPLPEADSAFWSLSPPYPNNNFNAANANYNNTTNTNFNSPPPHTAICLRSQTRSGKPDDNSAPH